VSCMQAPRRTVIAKATAVAPKCQGLVSCALQAAG
jgi:hypothetical protein